MPYAGGGMVSSEPIPSYFLGGLMKGLGGLSKVASMIPGPWQAPAMAVAGLTSLGGRGGGGGGGGKSAAGGGLGSQLMNFFGGGRGLASLGLPIASSLFRHFRGGNENPATRGRVMPQYNFPQQFQGPPQGGIAGLPSGAYGSFLQGMQNRYGMPQPQPGGGMGGGMGGRGGMGNMGGGMPGMGYGGGPMPRMGYGGGMPGMGGGMRPQMGGGGGPQTFAEGGPVRDDISFEGFIPPTNDGTMESSGAVDDRLALLKPDISEVTPDKQEMLEVVKEAIRNMDQSWAIEVIELAKETFGEEFIENLMEDMDIYDNELTPQADQDRMVEMQFRENLASGGAVPVAAAVAPHEYVFPARVMEKLGDGDSEVGAKKADKLRKDILTKAETTNRPLEVRVT